MRAILLAALLLAGCGASRQEMLVTAYEAQQVACLQLETDEQRQACVDTVRTVWGPVWAKEGEP